MSIVIKMVLTIFTGTISLSVAQSAIVSSTIRSKASTVISTIFGFYAFTHLRRSPSIAL
jgi:hypothetical protein